MLQKIELMLFFRKGSVLVDFSLTHHQYGGVDLDTQDLRVILEDELNQGQLGELKASTEKFEFSEVKGGKLQEE